MILGRRITCYIIEWDEVLLWYLTLELSLLPPWSTSTNLRVTHNHNPALDILLPVTLLQPLLGVKRNTRHHKPGFWMQIKTVLRKSVDFKLLHNPIYIVFCVSSVLYRFSCSAPVLFLPDRAVSFGHSTKTAALLLTVFGGTIIVGRIS